jgi:hypothetical protein
MAIVLYPNFLVKSIVNIMWPFLSEKSRSKLKMVNEVTMLKEFFSDENLMKAHGGVSNNGNPEEK